MITADTITDEQIRELKIAYVTQRADLVRRDGEPVLIYGYNLALQLVVVTWADGRCALLAREELS